MSPNLLIKMPKRKSRSEMGLLNTLQMALYAAVPFMVGHNAKRTTGVFWLNAAETWIDVRKSSNGVLSSLKNLVSRQVSPLCVFLCGHVTLYALLSLFKGTLV